MSTEKTVIGVAQVLQDLKDGLTREDIAKKYDISASECKMVFMDPRLKGKKTIKKPSFILVDDAVTHVEGVDAAAAAAVVVVVVEDDKTEDTVDPAATTTDDNADADVATVADDSNGTDDTAQAVKDGFGTTATDDVAVNADDLPAATVDAPKANWD